MGEGLRKFVTAIKKQPLRMLPPAHQPKGIRPMRLTAKRQTELMAIMARTENADILKR